MPTTYEKGKIYKFAFSRIAFWNDERYIVLKEMDTEQEKPGGYAASPWVLRVKALPFQEKWDNGEEWSHYDCLVTGFMKDCGFETTFPQLVQERKSVDEKLYGNADFDAPLSFFVTDTSGAFAPDGTQMSRWRVRDPKTNFFHYINFANEENTAFTLGQVVDVHPYRDNPEDTLHFISSATYGKIQAKQRRIQNMPVVFPLGCEVDCKVLSIDDPRFVMLSHPQIPEAIRIQKLPSALLPSIGETVRVKCTGFTATGWPILAWTGVFAETTIPVENLPVLVLPEGGESKVVEYKSSLVYPAGGTLPDVDKQLGQVIVRTAASMMNSEGGSIFVGVENDGTVCGIEKEGSFLMTDSEDEKKYPPDFDGMQLKINNIFKKKLGDSVGSLVEILPRQNPESNHLVLEIKVRANETDIPAYVNGRDLYVRYSGQTQLLVGEQAARFIVDRLRRLDGKRNKTMALSDDAADKLIKKISDILPVQTHDHVVKDELPIIPASNTTVPFERHHVDALSGFSGLAYDNMFVGSAKSWPDLLVELLKQLALIDPVKFEALPDEKDFKGRGGRQIFARKGARTRLRDASEYLGPNGDIRVDRLDGNKENFLKDSGLFVRLVRHFGLKPEQFRIWTGKKYGIG